MRSERVWRRPGSLAQATSHWAFWHRNCCARAPDDSPWSASRPPLPN